MDGFHRRPVFAMANGNSRERKLMVADQQSDCGVRHVPTLADACFDVDLPL
jgi:hypothetical protein